MTGRRRKGAFNSEGTGSIAAFGRSVAAFGSANLVAGVAWFALLPYVTSRFTPEDVGVFGAFRSGYQLLAPVLTWGVASLIMWSHLEKPSPTASLAGAGMLVSLGLGVAACLVAALGAPVLTDLGLPGWSPYAAVGVAWLVGAASMAESVFQMEHEPGRFLGLKLTDTGVFIIALLVVSGSIRDWQGIVGSQALASLTVAVLAVVSLVGRRLVDWRGAGEGWRRLRGYGSRLLPHLIGLWVANYVDRYIIAAMIGVDAAGLYVVAYSVSMAFSSVHEGVSRTFAPRLSADVQSGNESALRSSGLFVYRYTAWALVVSVVAILPAMALLDLLVDPSFGRSIRFLPWLIVAQAAFGLSRVLTGYLLSSDRVWERSRITLSTALVNLVLSLILVALLGADGAAIATLISFVLGAWLTYRAVRRSALLPSLGAVGGWRALFKRAGSDA